MRFLLAILLLSSCYQGQKSDLDYAAGEHVRIGDIAFQQICQSYDACSLPRKDREFVFSYGEIVALGGDFYVSAHDIFFEKKPAWYEIRRNRLEKLRELFKLEEKSIDKMLAGESSEYPDHSLSFTLNAKDYLDLVEDNLDHFGFYSLKRYIFEHKSALALAKRASQEKDEKIKEELLRLALFQNAFADHFLSDSFAAGHLRNPRRQTLSWALENALDTRTAGILSKILHDSEGRGDLQLWVENSRGQAWLAKADSELFASGNTEVASIVIEAVKLSVSEVIETARGENFEGAYRALEYVPFPSLNQNSLSDTFVSENMNLEKIFNDLDWYLKLIGVSEISVELIGKYLDQLESIDEAFKNDIRLLYNKETELQIHLPQAYIEGILQ